MKIINYKSPVSHYDCSEKQLETSVPSCLSLLLLPPRLLSASLSSMAEIFKETLNAQYNEVCPSCYGHHSKHKMCCSIPEKHCPSPYACRINWSGCPGDTLHYQIQLTNTAKIKRDFSLIPVEFPCTDDVIKVTPDKKSLLPEQSLKATASFTIPESFGGGIYRTRIKVVGTYAQYILVCLDVHAHENCCCEIEQGEIPKRIKAHYWYHHFQCEEPCFDAVQREGAK